MVVTFGHVNQSIYSSLVILTKRSGITVSRYHPRHYNWVKLPKIYRSIWSRTKAMTHTTGGLIERRRSRAAGACEDGGGDGGGD